MKIKLSKDIVDAYSPFVRITTSKNNKTVGSIRVSNSNSRWSLSSSDFTQLFGACIFMMAYTSDVIEEVRSKYDLRSDVQFEFEGYAPLELVSLVESRVDKATPKNGRPKPKYSSLDGTLAFHGTKTRKVAEVADTEKVEGSDSKSERFPNSSSSVLQEHLEVESTDVKSLKTSYKKLEKQLTQANERIAELEDMEKAYQSDKERWAAKEEGFNREKDLWENQKVANASYVETLQNEFNSKVDEVNSSLQEKLDEVELLQKEKEALEGQVSAVEKIVTKLKQEQENKTVGRALAELGSAIVRSFKSLFTRK
mgnify:CR=1 FL=1